MDGVLVIFMLCFFIFSVTFSVTDFTVFPVKRARLGQVLVEECNEYLSYVSFEVFVIRLVKQYDVPFSVDIFCAVYCACECCQNSTTVPGCLLIILGCIEDSFIERIFK